MVFQRVQPMDRFMRFIEPCPMTGCWLWTGAMGYQGYGVFTVKWAKFSTRTNRVAWELFKGEIPSGKWVLHYCDVRSCVNPNHLFLGTRQDNVDDMVNKGRHSNGNMHKTHCLNGHLLSGDNIYHPPSNAKIRVCKICRNEAGKIWKRKYRAARKFNG